VKLRGRTEAPDGAEGAQFLSARGARQTTHHGPLRWLDDATVTDTSSVRRSQSLKRVRIGALTVDAPTCAIEALNFITASRDLGQTEAPAVCEIPNRVCRRGAARFGTAVVHGGARRHLTVKLRGRTEAPDKRRGRTLSSRARGAKLQAPHGPLQRLLGISIVGHRDLQAANKARGHVVYPAPQRHEYQSGQGVQKWKAEDHSWS
jgi:hypothetical protein